MIKRPESNIFCFIIILDFFCCPFFVHLPFQVLLRCSESESANNPFQRSPLFCSSKQQPFTFSSSSSSSSKSFYVSQSAPSLPPTPTATTSTTMMMRTTTTTTTAATTTTAMTVDCGAREAAVGGEPGPARPEKINKV